MKTEGVQFQLEEQFQSLSQAERDFVSVAFLEDLPAGEVALCCEQLQRISTVLEMLRGINPLEGVEWAIQKLASAPEESVALGSDARPSFQEEL